MRSSKMLLLYLGIMKRLLDNYDVAYSSQSIGGGGGTLSGCLGN